MHTLVLPEHGTDFVHWRRMARALWQRQIPPEDLTWLTEYDQQCSPDLFATQRSVTGEEEVGQWGQPTLPVPSMTVPHTWLSLAEKALLHASPHRFAVLYRLLWRMQFDPAVRHNPLDVEHVQIQHWVKAVRQEVHKMHAFVRFRPVDVAPASIDGTGPLHVAWFEPTHHVVHAAAPFFVHRFANMRWAILTPQCSLRWWPQADSVDALEALGVNPHHALKPLQGRSGVLSWGPGAQASEAPAADAGEALWLTYYAHIFNPARLKVAAMRKEMPRKYWHNLPEARLIAPLIQASQAQSSAMLHRPASSPQRKLPSKK